MFAFMVSFYSIAKADDMNEVLQVPIWAMYGEFDSEQMTEWSPMFGQTMLW